MLAHFVKQPRGSTRCTTINLVFDAEIIQLLPGFGSVQFLRMRQLGARRFLQIGEHSQTSERRGEINFVALTAWSIRMVRNLVSAVNFLHHT